MTETTATRAATQPKIRSGWIMAILAVIGLLGLTAIQLFRTQQGQVAVGEIAPDFTVTGFANTPLAGQTLKLSEARGQLVLVNFWASWCIPCRDEAEALEMLWQNYKGQGLVVVGLAWSDTERESLKFINEFHQTYLNGPDLGTRAAQQYRIKGVPESFLVDQAGKLVWVKIGPTSYAELVSVIEPLLAE